MGSQSARTYLEKHYESFIDNGKEGEEGKTSEITKDELIVHALQALVGCVSGDDELTKENGSIAIVGPASDSADDDGPTKIVHVLIEGDDLQPYLDKLEIKRDEEDDDEDDDDDDDGDGAGDGEGGSGGETKEEE